MSQSTGGFGSGRPAFVARQDRRQVEPEPVDVHLGDPVAQAVLDQPAHDRLVGVERVAAATVIGVTRPVVLQDVVDVVGETAVAERRTVIAAFAVWLKTTSRMTSIPARWSALTMSRNSSARREDRSVTLYACAARRPNRLVTPVVHAAGGASNGSNWKTGSSSTAVMPRS